jgi:hypothetical protein
MARSREVNRVDGSKLSSGLNMARASLWHSSYGPSHRDGLIVFFKRDEQFSF